MNNFNDQMKSLGAFNDIIEQHKKQLNFLKESRKFDELLGVVKNVEHLKLSALLPTEELMRMQSLNLNQNFRAEIGQLSDHIKNFELQFRMPANLEIENLLRSINESKKSLVLPDLSRQHLQYADEIKLAMDSMRQPWIDKNNILGSIAGFSELIDIGKQIKLSQPFDESFAEHLRMNLGDWREPITIDHNNFLNSDVRTEFYLNQGFDPALTAFPSAAFVETTNLAGLRQDSLEIEVEENIDDDDNDIEERGLIRTNEAHGTILRLERQLRKFIDSRMLQAFGEHWIKQRVPNDVYKSWLEKREKAEHAGEKIARLIDYADFTDYQKIILRKDNWNEVFKVIFIRDTLVIECLQRLYPIRICTMHARLITQDDELYLMCESKRLMKAMGVN